MKKILVVVDMQNDFIDAALGTAEAVAIVDAVKEKISSYPVENVIATMDTHGENYTEIWRDNRGSGVDGNSYWCNDLQLSHDTRFIKFFNYGNCAAYYREISVTELVKFESDTEEIVLNETDNSTSFTFTHANARTGFITVTAPQGIAVDVPEFECGLDIYGEQTIGVTYDWLSGVDVDDDIIISDGAKTNRVHVVARIENPDGIVSPRSNAEEAGVIYNLAGQRIMKMQKGINIIGGRKVLK